MADRDTPTFSLVDKVLALTALLQQDMASYFEREGLTVARAHLLWALRAGPRTQQSLATELRVSARNITGLVDGLVGSGHLVRRRHPVDRRATHVTLTERGERSVADLVAGHREMETVMFAEVPARDLAAFERTLDGVITRLATRLAEPTA
jgi:DNA-binding MarR family transcriptional regulator